MKKLIKATLCIFLIFVQVSLEFYPTGKVLVKRHLAEVDFEKVLSVKRITESQSFLSIKEKRQIVLILEDFFHNQTK